MSAKLKKIYAYDIKSALSNKFIFFNPMDWGQLDFSHQDYLLNTFLNNFELTKFTEIYAKYINNFVTKFSTPKDKEHAQVVISYLMSSKIAERILNEIDGWSYYGIKNERLPTKQLEVRISYGTKEFNNWLFAEHESIDLDLVDSNNYVIVEEPQINSFLKDCFREYETLYYIFANKLDEAKKEIEIIKSEKSSYPPFDLTEFKTYVENQMENLYLENKFVFKNKQRKYNKRKGYLQYIYEKCKDIRKQKYAPMGNKFFANKAVGVINHVFDKCGIEIKEKELERNL